VASAVLGGRILSSASSMLLAPILRGMRRNLVPGLVLQATAVTTIVLYLRSAGAHAWLDSIGQAKLYYGYLFSALSTCLFGGVIPFLVLLAAGRTNKAPLVWQLLFYLVFWTWKGVEVDAFYRLQGALFGNDASFSVIVKKLLVDQFVYNPLWAGPTQVWCFLWYDSNFSRAAMRSRFDELSLGRRVVIVLFSSWIVWIPTVAVIYALPAALQVPLFNLVICFWSLLLASLSKRGG
jgi:hypothetical protein